MSVTVEDLLKLPSLGGARVAAGKSGLKKVVTSISVLEYANPQMLNDDLFPGDFYGGEIAITGFINAREDVPLQLATIRRLYEGGEVGLILYYVGIFLKDIAPEVAALADELGFVLICMPKNRMDLRYSEVITEVMHAIISEQKRDTYLVGEMLERFGYLPESQRTVESVVRMLSDRLRCSLFLVDSRFRPVNLAVWPQAGESSMEELEQFYGGEAPGASKEMERLPSGRWVFCVPVKDADNAGLTLFLVREDKKLHAQLCLQAAEAVRLFIGVWSRGYGNVGTGELLKAILNDEPVKMRRLAEIFQIDVKSIHHMLLLLPRKKKAERNLEKEVRHASTFLEQYYDICIAGIHQGMGVVFTGQERTKMEQEQILEAFYEEGDKEIRLISCPGLENTAQVRSAFLLCTEYAEEAGCIFPCRHIRHWKLFFWMQTAILPARLTCYMYIKIPSNTGWESSTSSSASEYRKCRKRGVSMRRRQFCACSVTLLCAKGQKRAGKFNPIHNYNGRKSVYNRKKQNARQVICVPLDWRWDFEKNRIRRD